MSEVLEAWKIIKVNKTKNIQCWLQWNKKTKTNYLKAFYVYEDGTWEEVK